MAETELNPEEQELIRKHREQKAREEAEGWKPRPLDDIPDDEKISKFNAFYESAAQMLEEHKNGDFREDNKQYTWEAVMQLLAKPGKIPELWKAFNKLG